MPTKNVLAKAIKYHRERLGWTLAKASELSGIRQATWCDLEGAKKNPTLNTIEAVAFTLGVPVSALFTLYWPANDLRDDTSNPES
jgi:transcriptional regulator with XRE-family HTH domain